MDHQMQHSNEGFATSNNTNVFADGPQYHAYDNLFQSGPDQTSYDAGWGINASNYPGQSRAQPASTPSWPQNTGHLSLPPTHAHGPSSASAYARSLSHSPAPYGQTALDGYSAPHNLQYRQPQFDPALVQPTAFNPHFNYPTVDYQSPNAGTIAPHALQHDNRSAAHSHKPYNASTYQSNSFAQSRPARLPVSEYVDQAGLSASVPAGKNQGRFAVIDFSDLSQATKSERMGSFVNIGTQPLHWDVNRAALPPYVPRKSRNQLRRLAANDPKLLARLGKTGAKKQRTLAGAVKLTSAPANANSPAGDRTRYEGESPSDDDSSSEDDDDSSYTSDDGNEVSPLPENRPENLKAATEYDAIKSLWRGKRRALASDSIRKGLGEFWEIVKTIRDRWKADVAAVSDAEAKNRVNELPLLQSRVKDQRDMLETAFKAALKHGHREILALMSENVSLLFLCYQFLLDRAKAEDYNSALPRTLLETMSLFDTVTEQKLEQTHLVKVLPRYSKKGDVKTQFYAKRITANAAAAAGKNAQEASKKTLLKESVVASPPSKVSEPGTVAGIKRSASNAGDGGVQKKVATGAHKTNGVPSAARQASTLKKTSSGNEVTKAASNAAAAAPKPKQVVAKPSGLFASLQSAGKKPGTSNASKSAHSAATGATSRPSEKSSGTAAVTGPKPAPMSTFSFAETMANLSKPKEEKPAAKPDIEAPSETPEEKRKRLRKESRRHLHVSFKTGSDLVEIREFSHDPDEELGHDANQMRDLADVGGEGRMFKQQHHMMDLDDEDEVAHEEAKLMEFTAPTAVDFTVVEREERVRNAVRFGGEVEPESKERTAREQYETNTLIVFYANSDDIPPNPREPSDPDNGEKVDAVKQFGKPEEKWASRAQHQRPAYTQSVNPNQQGNSAIRGFDFSNLTNFMQSQQQPPHSSYQQPAPQLAPTPPIAANNAISNILASLRQAQAGQGTPPVPSAGGMSGPFSMAQPTVAPQSAAPPAGQPDLAAILAQIQQNQAGPPQQPSFGFNGQAAIPAMNSFQPSMQQPAIYENLERKQWREGGDDNAAKPRKPLTSAQHPWYRTKVCKYWQEGRCQKGDQCSYKHDES